MTTVAALGVALAVPLFSAGPADAHGSGRLYVAPNGAARNSDTSCRHAQYTDIQAAIEDARPGGTVVVCRGVYATSVTVDRRITLAGMPGAVIDATGAPYGVGITASWSTVRGLTVVNASGDNPDFPYDGIITAGFTAEGPAPADHVMIINNRVHGNKGSGIDLNSTSHSIARGNIATENGVGINVADDLGAPAANNVIAENVTNRNFGGCGIALADHTGAGVVGNLVTGNISDDNGLATPTAPDASAGSGVILASPIPGGTVKNNVISYNEFHGNGHGGVVVHSHVPNIPDGPMNDFTGNQVIGNLIGTNNLRTDEADLETTGIYLGSASPLQITVRGNWISDNHFGIFTAGDVTVTGSNTYTNVDVQMDGVSSF
ncbi:MAG TPA: right-handed parallel beta-helix repeat-containing protein [Jatrophihabitans sp.]|nr:right-handed parallel beta-helix repeat-containing protein [Jatrophihabitans sp.]